MRRLPNGNPCSSRCLPLPGRHGHLIGLALPRGCAEISPNPPRSGFVVVVMPYRSLTARETRIDSGPFLSSSRPASLRFHVLVLRYGVASILILYPFLASSGSEGPSGSEETDERRSAGPQRHLEHPGSRPVADKLFICQFCLCWITWRPQLHPWGPLPDKPRVRPAPSMPSLQLGHFK